MVVLSRCLVAQEPADIGVVVGGPKGLATRVASAMLHACKPFFDVMRSGTDTPLDWHILLRATTFFRHPMAAHSGTGRLAMLHQHLVPG